MAKYKKQKEHLLLRTDSNRTKGVPHHIAYEGKTKKSCKGKCLWGSRPQNTIFSLCFFNAPALLILVRAIPQYFDNIHIFSIMLATLLFMFFLVNTLALCTAFANPGIMPRGHQ